MHGREGIPPPPIEHNGWYSRIEAWASISFTLFLTRPINWCGLCLHAACVTDANTAHTFLCRKSKIETTHTQNSGKENA